MEDETIDQFVCHLPQKAISCEFPDMGDAIRDQIIEKCRDPKLQRKFLEKASTASLSVLQETARIHEAVDTQMQSMENHEPEGQVSFVKHHKRKQENKGNKSDSKKRGDKNCYYAFVLKGGNDKS